MESDERFVTSWIKFILRSVSIPCGLFNVTGYGLKAYLITQDIRHQPVHSMCSSAMVALSELRSFLTVCRKKYAHSFSGMTAKCCRFRNRVIP